jgi:hypothetical protein
MSTTIEEAKHLQIEMEKNLTDILLNFEKDTGLYVESVDLLKTRADYVGKNSQLILVTTSVKI